jgi:hypothetical protein
MSILVALAPSRRTLEATLPILLSLLVRPLAAQTVPAPTATPASAPPAGHRPLPGSVFETAEFSRAVLRGTRTRTGRPGETNWVQHARYRIDARLDVRAARLTGHERVTYLNNSPDTLSRVAVYLRQNVFAPGSPRSGPLPVTGGVTLRRVAADGRVLGPTLPRPGSSQGSRAAAPGYAVSGTVMWIGLPRPLLPGDSTRLEFAWSFTPPPAPADGREGHDGDVFFLGYWYPQVAVYDDVSGWVTDPYLSNAEFYMDPADYDVRIEVPRGWVVGATGVLQDAATVLSRQTLERLAAARGRRETVHVLTQDEWRTGRAFASTSTAPVWHFTATGVRDFAWGTSNRYLWDATSALIPDSARGPGGTDTVMINSFFRARPGAAAWRIGGARFTRDAIAQMSAYLWPYPWPQMTSMEGVLRSGGMEYPMMTLMRGWADTLSLAGDLMHETGHMWFPMQVGSNETRHPWMDEGLTQYDVAQCMRVLYGEPRAGGRPNDSESGQRASYLGAARLGRDVPLMRRGDLFPADLYFVVSYNKTAQVLAALRSILGEPVFHRALREYGRRWIGRHPDPADFFNTFDEASGRDLSWFWVSWFYRAWPLDQAIGSVHAEGDSLAIVVVDRGLAPMPVRLAVTRADGAVERVTLPVSVWLGGARQAVVRVAGSPAVVRVEIDPEADFPDLDRANQVWERRAGARAPG